VPGNRSQRRDSILALAAQRASLDGLDGLTLGGLAEQLGISKGGIQGLFGSKEQLQLATVDTAVGIFEQRVLALDERIDDGLPRLRVLMDAWIDYLEDAFEGGCFFCAAAVELDGRPGPLRDALLAFVQRTRRIVRHEVRLAQRLGELSEDVDPDQLTFELHATILEANFSRQLFGDKRSLDRARSAIAARLQEAEPASMRTKISRT
jgi:AcrR family transcriptional regulator